MCKAGVSSIQFYDPRERAIATVHPNQTYAKLVFGPWEQASWDANDTVLGDPRTDADVKGVTEKYFDTLANDAALPPWQTWHAQRHLGALGALEQTAALRAAAHANTPVIVYMDALGRPVLTVAHNKVVCQHHDLDGTESKLHTRVDLDIEGNQLAVRDAAEQGGDASGRLIMTYAYDMLGNLIHQNSMDAGARWILNDVAGKPLLAWDSRGHTFRTEYDPMRRPTRSFVTGADPVRPSDELLTERQVYGEQHPDAQAKNLRGALYLYLDQAGAVEFLAHDFNGNPLRISRRIANEYKQAIDWSAIDAALPSDAASLIDMFALEAALTPMVENDRYTSLTKYDALSRPVTLTTPHTPAMQPSVIRPSYNQTDALERIDVNVRSDTDASGQPVWTPFVTNVNYSAKGQRQRIDYGNNVSTLYDYDPLTSRLTRLQTRRDLAVFPDDCPATTDVNWPGCHLQDLNYTYDPVGNVLHIADNAQQKIFFRNQRIEPSSDYVYDATYRLIQAKGREHLGQVGGAPIAHSHNDAPRVGISWSSNDGNAMGAYIERYVYDAVGNF